MSTAEKLPTKDRGSSQLVVKMQPHSISSRDGLSKRHSEVLNIKFSALNNNRLFQNIKNRVLLDKLEFISCLMMPRRCHCASAKFKCYKSDVRVARPPLPIKPLRERASQILPDRHGVGRSTKYTSATFLSGLIRLRASGTGPEIGMPDMNSSRWTFHSAPTRIGLKSTIYK